MSGARRDTEELREEILGEAEKILVEDGPEGLRLGRIAVALGMNQDAVLRHFSSMEELYEALHQRAARHIRADLLDMLDASKASRGDVITAISDAMTKGSDPSRGRLLAWLVTTGRSPFPDGEEGGLARIADRVLKLAGGREEAREMAEFVTLLPVLAVFGDAVVGEAVRERLGLSSDPETGRRFRRWVVEVMTKELVALAAPPASPE